MSKSGRPQNKGLGPNRLVKKAEKHNAKMRASNEEMMQAVDVANKKTVISDEVVTMAVGQIWLLKREPTVFAKGESEIKCRLPNAHKVVIVSCDASAGLLHETGLIRVVKVLPLIPVSDLSGNDELTLLAEQLEKPFKNEHAIQCWNPQLVLFYNFYAKVGQVKPKSALFQFLSSKFDSHTPEQERIIELMLKTKKFTSLSSKDQLRISVYRSMKYIRHPYQTLDRMSIKSFVRKITRSNRV